MAALHRFLPLLLLGMGCNKPSAKDTPAPAAEEGKAEAPSESPPEKPHEGTPAGAGARPGRYGVPFAWEMSPDEPLARARKFMAEVLAANTTFMAQGRAHFTPFAEGEKPRATVLTCADSRVQAGAWDASPENDDYTVRNLGNQLATSLGSLEYGVEHLHTPVLLIIGHTGCDAVKAVMNQATKGKDAMSEELSRMNLGQRRRGGDGGEWDALTSAVVANVDAQVTQAVTHFSPFVQSGELTVLGAVYDITNALGEGHGRLRIVNVNGNVERERTDAFVEAVKKDAKPAPAPSFAASRPKIDPGQAPLDDTYRPPPGTPRATINAVSVLGSGGLDAASSGTVRASGGILPGTSDLKLAPGASRYANVGRRPAPGAGAAGDPGAPAAEHEPPAPKPAGNSSGAVHPGTPPGPPAGAPARGEAAKPPAPVKPGSGGH